MLESQAQTALPGDPPLLPGELLSYIGKLQTGEKEIREGGEGERERERRRRRRKGDKLLYVLCIVQ